MTPLVSIITPTYNHQPYIAACIDSVIAQTYTNWEMIVLDDGSTDATLSIARAYALNDSRIKVFTQENKGIFRLGENYNTAFSKSSGKYIAILEGDDVWLPEKLELQINTLEDDEQAVLSWGQAYGSSMDLKTQFQLFPIIPYEKSTFRNTPVGSALKVFLFTNHIPALTVVIRRQALEAAGGFACIEGLPTMDLPTWQKLAQLGSFTFIGQPLGHWRTSLGQATKNHTVKLIEGIYHQSLRVFDQNESFAVQYGITRAKINKHFQQRLVVNHYYAGDYNLKRGDVSAAISDFKKAIFLYGCKKPLWKIRAFAGLIKCWTR